VPGEGKAQKNGRQRKNGEEEEEVEKQNNKQARRLLALFELFP